MFSNKNDFQPFESKVWLSSPTMYPDSMKYVMEKRLRIIRQNFLDKTVSVICRARPIGSSFIKTILWFKSSTLVVVDTNENALGEPTCDIRSTLEKYVLVDFCITFL